MLHGKDLKTLGGDAVANITGFKPTPIERDDCATTSRRYSGATNVFNALIASRIVRLSCRLRRVSFGPELAKGQTILPHNNGRKCTTPAGDLDFEARANKAVHRFSINASLVLGRICRLS